MDNKRIAEMVRLHELWLRGDPEGAKAVFCGEDFSECSLEEANLKGSVFYRCYFYKSNFNRCNFEGADFKKSVFYQCNFFKSTFTGSDLSDSEFNKSNLEYCHLTYCNLTYSSLRESDLSYSNFHGSDLSYSDLSHSIICCANLSDTNLYNSNISHSDLSNTNLYNSYLSGASIKGVKFNDSTTFFTIQCPEKGSYIGFKKANGAIVELLIPEDALRSSATSRKCRASKVKVLSITAPDGLTLNEVASDWDKNFIYRVGETVEVTDFNKDRWNECSAGIHHFITRKEAEMYE